ncbi:MAG: DUF1573 domain-containing protein [Armatimonadota bacterium]
MRKPPPAFLTIAAAIVGTGGALWYRQWRDALYEEATLVARKDVGIVLGRAPVHVEWSFRNTDEVSWHIVSSQQSCGCTQIHLNQTVIPPGGVLLVNTTVDLPIGVTPEDPERSFEQRVILPFTVRAANKTYRLVGVVEGKRICPLVQGPSFLVVEFQEPSGFRRYCWQIHSQVEGKILAVQCTLPQDYVSVSLEHGSLCLIVRSSKKEESYEGNLKVYHKITRTELLRIPIVIRVFREWGR